MTLNTQDGEALFGSFGEDGVLLSDIGQIVEDEWLRTPSVRSNVSVDVYVVMPDHFHGIVVINEERNGGMGLGVSQYAQTRTKEDLRAPFRSPSRTLGAIIRGFKGASTKKINELRGTPGAPVWQRNYYEHIIRDKDELDRIRAYIDRNVEAWMKRHKIKHQVKR